jgi:hypothetical protein
MQIQATKILDFGMIASMDLPDGWIEGLERRPQGVSNECFFEFHSPEQPRASLCFHYNGLPVSAFSANAFASILAEDPHTVPHGEVSALHDILRDKASEAFILADAHTENFNGKRVLFLTGRYKEIEEDVYQVYIDASGDGRLVQEVFFQSPTDAYKEYLPEARKAIESIVWR